MQLNKNLNYLLSKIDSLNKNQILNGLVAPILRDYYGWDRENIETVEVGNPLTDCYDLLLKGVNNLISVSILSDLNELNAHLEDLISHNKNKHIRFQLILAKNITRFYDAKHCIFKENVNFYDPESLSCIHVNNEPSISNEFDFDIIQASLSSLKSEQTLSRYLNSTGLNIDEESVECFLKNFNIIPVLKPESRLGADFINIKDIDLNKADLLFETGLIEFAVVDQLNILFRIKNNENKKHWSTGYSYLLDFLFMLDIDLSDTFFQKDKNPITLTLSQDKNRFIDALKTTVIIHREKTHTFRKISILVTLIQYLEQRRNLNLDIYVNYERRNKND